MGIDRDVHDAVLNQINTLRSNNMAPSFVVRTGNVLIDQFKPSFFATTFPFVFKYGTGMPDYGKETAYGEQGHNPPAGDQSASVRTLQCTAGGSIPASMPGQAASVVPGHASLETGMVNCNGGRRLQAAMQEARTDAERTGASQPAGRVSNAPTSRVTNEPTNPPATEVASK